MAKKFRSKLEEECYYILKELFPHTPIDHDYHVGHGLKLDFLIKGAIPIAVEMDGPQHKKFNARFHKDISDFEAQVRRDKQKDQICADMGVPVVRIDDKKELTKDIIHCKIMAAIDEHECRLDGVDKKKEVSKSTMEYRNSCKERARKRRKDHYKWMKDKKSSSGQSF